MRSDGVIFESLELDYTYKFLKQVTFEKISIEEAFYPKRLVTDFEVSKWKKCNFGGDDNMRMVHYKDPMSFYTRFGNWGTKPLSDAEKADRKPLPLNYPEYELWMFRRMGRHGWR